MADSECRGDLPVKVWTFIIRGGDERLSIRLPNNPPLVHDGRLTVWHLLGTEKLASAAEELIRSAGATVSKQAEVQTEDQAEERECLLGNSSIPPRLMEFDKGDFQCQTSESK